MDVNVEFGFLKVGFAISKVGFGDFNNYNGDVTIEFAISSKRLVSEGFGFVYNRSKLHQSSSVVFVRRNKLFDRFEIFPGNFSRNDNF